MMDGSSFGSVAIGPQPVGEGSVESGESPENDLERVVVLAGSQAYENECRSCGEGHMDSTPEVDPNTEGQEHDNDDEDEKPN